MTQITVPRSVLADAEARFLAGGDCGYEVTGMLAAGPDGVVTSLVVPEQRANPAPYCWVEITDRGKLELAAALGPDEIYVARIHSHPRNAFHSSTDDKNPSLTYPGALSIVAPNFGARLSTGLDDCAIYRRVDRAWHPLSVGPLRDRYIVCRD